MSKILVIVIVHTWYHPDASGSKSTCVEFYDLQKAEKYYFDLEKDDGAYQHTTINIYQREV